MEYKQAGSNELLQEYFIPVDEFAGFTQALKQVLEKEPELDLLVGSSLMEVGWLIRSQSIVTLAAGMIYGLASRLDRHGAGHVDLKARSA